MTGRRQENDMLNAMGYGLAIVILAMLAGFAIYEIVDAPRCDNRDVPVACAA